MSRPICALLFALSFGHAAWASDADVVFRSDVMLVRVDTQVLDRDNHAVTGLRPEDFVLRDEGRPQPIRNFAREEMPVDVLLLLDVSVSMRPHVERISSAARQAMQVLGEQDRVGIMVFDRVARLRLPFAKNLDEVDAELRRLLRQEGFNGGTDITRGLVDAAEYVARSARREARRAIVIVTDDQTERQRDEAHVSDALVGADAVLMALIAPDAMRSRGRSPGMGGSWPSGGRSRGGIIFGPGGPYGGGRRPGSGGAGSRTRSAGTAEIARESGGDSFPVDRASALETALSSIRQRYALHFLTPADAKPGQRRTLSVELSEAAIRRYPGAEVRFRRSYMAPGGAAANLAVASAGPAEVTAAPARKRRMGVSEPSGPRGPNLSGGPVSTPAAEPQPDAAPAPKPGWRRAKPEEQQ